MIVAGIVVACLCVCFFLYNNLISKKNEIDNAQGGLDASLKQRYDLIPNLVSSVKMYMKHEASTLEKIVELRSQGMKDNLSAKSKQEVNQQISQGLSQIILQAEQYPELKSNTNFMDLQKSLYVVEENISASRRFFNAAVTDYNNGIEMFPSSIFAKMMGLKRKMVFSIPDIERQNVNVANLFGDKAS